MEALKERDGMQCTWCCRPMIDAPILPDDDCSEHMTLEHLMPLVLGGTHEMSNLALACHGCNNARGSNVEWSYEDVEPALSVCS